MSGGWSGLLAKTVVVGAISYGFPELTGVALSTAAIETLFGDLTQSGVDRWNEGDDTGDLNAVMAGAAAAVEDAARAHGIGEEDGRALLAAVLTMVHRAGFAADRVVAAGYSPAALADAIIVAKPAVYEPLTERQRDLLRILLTAAIRGGLDTPESLASAGAAFRRTVLERTRVIDAATRRLPQETAREMVTLLRRLAVGAMLLPNRPERFHGDADSTNALLSAAYEAVPFIGRGDMLDEMEGWCEGEPRVGIRLYIGSGGVGKTRLMRELCRRMAGRDWLAGFLDPALDPPSANDMADILPADTGGLLIIDYADIPARAEHVKAILTLARRMLDRGSSRLRLVLIARGRSDLWDGLCRRLPDPLRSLLQGPMAAPDPLSLRPLDPSERAALFSTALESFATKLRRGRPAAPNFDLTHDRYGDPLVVQMVALALLDEEPAAARRDRLGLLDWMIERQRQLWSSAFGGDDGLARACAQAVAVIHAAQGVADVESANRLLRKLPLLADQPELVRLRVREVLRAQHPGPHYLNGLAPDALGDRLFRLEIKEEPILFDLASEFEGHP